MVKILQDFKDRQKQTLDILKNLMFFLEQGEQVGVKIDQSLFKKINNAIDSVSGEKLKVVLVGGFSEGKTSIAAAWLERLDYSSMKISHKESSNEIKIYEIENDLLLIDTPGLFGFKEKINNNINAIEKYKEITKKYVSEAHLVIYVMSPTNPIKESHKDDLNWLLRELNLLPRTVFVLSRFDEVSDVEDEQEYQINLNVKRENVIGRLRQLVGLNDHEVSELSIVAVAANPFDLGFDHWLSNPEQFKSLSHISNLQIETSKKIDNNGGKDFLVSEMKSSIIRDVLLNQLPVAIEYNKKIDMEVDRLHKLDNNLKLQIVNVENQIEAARSNLREFVNRYFPGLIIRAKGCSLETFADFFEKEIGSEGVVLISRLQNEFSRYTQPINLELKTMQLGFDTEVNHFNVAIRKIGKDGVNHVLNSKIINNTTILAARDGIVHISKMIGVDVTKMLKFKPWGAVKFAKGINGFLGIANIGFEVWDSWEKSKKEVAFREAINKIVDNLETQRNDLLNIINNNEFKEKFFGEYLVLKKELDALDESLKESSVRQNRFKMWRESAEAIDADFKALN